MTTILTERLRLRPLIEDDAIYFAKYLPEIDKNLSLIAPKSEAEARELIKNYFVDINAGYSVRFSVEDKLTTDFIGNVGVYDLNKDWPDRHCWIKKESQRKGYAFEAISAFMNWANNNLDYDVIYSSFDVTNLAMAKLNEKLGGVKGDEEPKPVDQGNGKTLNIVWYEYRNPNRVNS